MNKTKSILSVGASALLAFSCTGGKSKTEVKPVKPNIVVIYTDDLGYGDVGCYTNSGKSITPNIDQLANTGIKFTHGYATSATCTPSRYSLLTGQYSFRNKRAQILKGDAPLLIEPGSQTLPSVLRKTGYKTGIVGKWHLGLGDGKIDWNGDIKPGPLEVGFDQSYIMAATNDRVPTVYVDNHRIEGLEKDDPIEVSYKTNFPGEPTGEKNRELLTTQVHSHGHNMSVHNGVGRIGFMRGGKSALWKDETMADVFLNKAKKFVTENKNKPFFLYYALHEPHVPRVPHQRFVGKSGMGPRGDAIVEADWCIGEFMKTLKKLGIDKNTIVIFSSDNGPVLDDGYHDDAVAKLGNHKPAGPLRGGKYSLFDAGTHVPFIVNWPGTVKPGVSDALVCQVDLLASMSKLTGAKYDKTDSEDILDALLGKSKVGRKDLILEASRKTCYRSGDWIMIPPYKGRAITNKWVNIETGRSKEYQLYNIKEDAGQKNNLANSNPKKLEEMKKAYQKALKGNS